MESCLQKLPSVSSAVTWSCVVLCREATFAESGPGS